MIRLDRIHWLTLGVVTFSCLGTVANAQTPDRRNFDANRLRPAMSQEGILNVETGFVPGSLEWDASLWLDYSDDAYVIEENGRRVASLLQSRTDAHVLASIALFNSIQLGVDIPVTLNQTRGARAIQTFGFAELEATGLNDIALLGKVRLMSEAVSLFDLAAIARFTVTTAAPRDNYLGERKSTFTPELAASRNLGPLRLAANLALLFRDNLPSRSVNLNIDHELILRVGASYDFAALVGRPLRGELTVEAFTPSRRPFNRSNTTGAEWIAGVALPVSDGAEVFGGAGTALAQAYSIPDYRVFGGVRLFERNTDRDEDGILDRRDRCPDAPEDVDQFEDEDGCPDLDNDEDGVPDVNDGAPDRPEDVDGFEDEDGVPDPDNDGDSILDGDDAAPNAAEDVDGFEDADGAPDPDNDGDGVLDVDDRAPNSPEDVDGFEDEDGAPDPDNDGDGLLDGDDGAPDAPEDFDGFQDEDGIPDPDNDGDGVIDGIDNCPDEPGRPENAGCEPQKPQLVEIRDCRLEIKERIYFDSGRGSIQSRSYGLLDNIADVLLLHPEIKRLRVEGHTDSRGPEATNLQLSQERADSVAKYLTSRKIDASRIEAVGLGESQPIQPNATSVGRAANRRVEFIIEDCKKKVLTE